MIISYIALSVTSLIGILAAIFFFRSLLSNRSRSVKQLIEETESPEIQRLMNLLHRYAEIDEKAKTDVDAFRDDIEEWREDLYKFIRLEKEGAIKVIYHLKTNVTQISDYQKSGCKKNSA